MLIEIILYISLISMLCGITVPLVIDSHNNIYKTIEKIKEEYKK